MDDDYSIDEVDGKWLDFPEDNLTGRAKKMGKRKITESKKAARIMAKKTVSNTPKPSHYQSSVPNDSRGFGKCMKTNTGNYQDGFVDLADGDEEEAVHAVINAIRSEYSERYSLIPAYRNTWENSCNLPQQPSKQMKPLVDFIRDCVCIDHQWFVATSAFVDELLGCIFNKMLSLYKPGDPIILPYLRCGSSADNLKIFEPNEYDVVVPLHLEENYVFDFLHDKVPTGMALCLMDTPDNSALSDDMKKCVVEDPSLEKKHLKRFYLSTHKFVRDWFIPLITRAITELAEKGDKTFSRLKTWNVIDFVGTAVTMEISINSLDGKNPTRQQNISIDIVPALPLVNGGKWCDDTRVAVPTKLFSSREDFRNHYNIDETPLDQIDLFWKISHSVHENAFINMKTQEFGAESCHRECLKILKAFKKFNPDMNSRDLYILKDVQSSYEMKTALFFVLNRDRTDWSFDRMPEILAEMGQFLDKCLQANYLPNFFYGLNADILSDLFPLEPFFAIDRIYKPRRTTNILHTVYSLATNLNAPTSLPLDN